MCLLKSGGEPAFPTCKRCHHHKAHITSETNLRCLAHSQVRKAGLPPPFGIAFNLYPLVPSLTSGQTPCM